MWALTGLFSNLFIHRKALYNLNYCRRLVNLQAFPHPSGDFSFRSWLSNGRESMVGVHHCHLALYRIGVIAMALVLHGHDVCWCAFLVIKAGLVYSAEDEVKGGQSDQGGYIGTIRSQFVVTERRNLSTQDGKQAYARLQHWWEVLLVFGQQMVYWRASLVFPRKFFEERIGFL